MGVLAVDELVEGMTVTEDVYDRSGRLLLGRDTVLAGKHLRMFRMWGITEVDILGSEGEGDGGRSPVDIDPERLLAVEEKLRPLFRKVNFGNPAMEELFRLCLLRKVRNESN